MSETSASAVVIEEGAIPRRVRRPIDLARMVGALLGIVAIVLVATVAQGTVSGIDKDVVDNAAHVPGAIAWILGIIAGFGTIVLPSAIAADMLGRRRFRLLAEATAAGALAAIALLVVATALNKYGTDRTWYALTGSLDRTDAPLQPFLAAVFAFLTVARVRGTMSTIAAVVMTATLTADSTSGNYTVAALGISTLAGWATGLAVRYALGTPTTRPRGKRVAELLLDNGIQLTHLRATESTHHGRRFVATIGDQQMHIVVLDRDLEGAGVIPRWWRGLRLRDEDAIGGWSMREAVERAALISYSGIAAGAPVPHIHLVRALGRDACVLAFEWIDGTSLETYVLEERSVDEPTLTASWRALHALHNAGIAHRSICADHIIERDTGNVSIVHSMTGTVAMSDLQQRIDVADMLVTLALVSDPQRAVAAGRAVMGDRDITRALPALQPFALNKENRRHLRKHSHVLPQLREAIAELTPGEELEDVSIERLQPRKFFALVGGMVAAYLLISQFASVDITVLLERAHLGWVMFTAGMAFLTFVGATLSVYGLVPERLPIVRLFMVQLSAAFATLVTPAGVGTVAMNGRFLQKHGLKPTAAGATVAVSQVVAFIIHILLMFAAGLVAGSTTHHMISPPHEVWIAVGVLVVLTVAILPLPVVREQIVRIARPRVEEILPRLVMLAQRPQKLALAISGMLLLNIAYCLVLVGSVHAFGGDGSIAAISLVYLAGSTIGQAAPTPGGIGAVETLMTAGLVTTGIASPVAVFAVLLFRLLTFWLPPIPGWFAMNYLSRRGDL